MLLVRMIAATTTSVRAPVPTDGITCAAIQTMTVMSPQRTMISSVKPPYNSRADNGIDLTQVPRYATGPCNGVPFGQCKLATRTYGVANGQTVEIVTARGFVWRWLAGGTSAFVEVQPSGVPMTNVASWAGGPCQ